MQRRTRRLWLLSSVGIVGLLAGAWFVLLPASVGAQHESTLKDIAQGRTRTSVATTPAGVTRAAPSPSGGVINAALAALSNFSSDDTRAEEADAESGPNAAAI